MSASDRRQFMRRAVGASLALAGAGGLGLGLWSDAPPTPGGGAASLEGLPSFAAPNTAGRLAVATGGDRAALVRAALEAVGGLKDFIAPGQKVLIKVNAAFASPPAVGATTHPETLAAVISACRQAGAGEVVVSDNPIQDPAACFQLSGLAQAAREAGATLLLPRPEEFQAVSLPGGRLIRDWPVLTGALAGVERVIGLAPVKDHHRSGASLSMKNWYGLLGGRRNIFHQDIHGIIAELAALMRPSLVILDGFFAMLTNGPTGGSLEDLRPTGTMIAGTDQVAVDARAAELLGKTPADLPFLARAAALGAGTVDWRSLSPKTVEA